MGCMFPASESPSTMCFGPSNAECLSFSSRQSLQQAHNYVLNEWMNVKIDLLFMLLSLFFLMQTQSAFFFAVRSYGRFEKKRIIPIVGVHVSEHY